MTKISIILVTFVIFILIAIVFLNFFSEKLEISMDNYCESEMSRLRINNDFILYYNSYYTDGILRKGKLTDEDNKKIIEVFEENKFFSLNESYKKIYALYLCYKNITVKIGGKTKTIIEYGEQAPEELHKIQNFLIDMTKNLPEASAEDCQLVEDNIRENCNDYFASKKCNFSDNDYINYATNLYINSIGEDIYNKHLRFNKIDYLGSACRIHYNFSFYQGSNITDMPLLVRKTYSNNNCSLISPVFTQSSVSYITIEQEFRRS